jgi:hypothetical protein
LRFFVVYSRPWRWIVVFCWIFGIWGGILWECFMGSFWFESCDCRLDL